MFDFDQERELEKALEPTHAPDPKQRQILGDELLRAFEEKQLAPRREPVNKSRALRKFFFGAAIAAAIGVAACAAPVDVNVDIGKSVTIAFEASEPPAELKKIEEAIEHAGKFESVQMRLRRENNAVVLQAEVWGESAADINFTDSLKKSFPSLAAATITEKNLAGNVESTLGKKIAHELFDIEIADEKDVEAIRQKILADLAAKGVEGKVDVQVQNEADGKKKVMIQIEREAEDCEPKQGTQKQTP